MPRIIPAYAGSTCREQLRDLLLQDHPRVCGEHTVSDGLSAIAGGSSPRMRGARYVSNPTPGVNGIIPAYAGSTPAPSMGTTPIKDHPRVCGEHDEFSDVAHALGGSSPRMRGALSRQRIRPPRRRIIPAYAGST